MKTQFLAAALCLLALPFSAAADTFFMKDGSTLEGRVLREDPTSYFVEVAITKSIKDERSIPKSDVSRIEKVQPDAVAFEPIAKLVPAPDFLNAEEYAWRINAVEKFLKEYRGSSKTKQANQILSTLKGEANEILAGGVKINGKVVPPADYRANLYEIDAHILEAKIRALVKGSHYLAALRAFSELDRDFRNTTAHAAIAPLIERVIAQYMAEISQSLATFDDRVKARAVGLERMPVMERRSTENAIREENEAIEKQFKAEKDAKIGWVTTYPFFKPSLDDTLAFAKQELTRLAALKTAKTTVDAGKIYRDTFSLIQSKGDTAAVTSSLNAAKSAGLAPRYMDRLEAIARANGLLR